MRRLDTPNFGPSDLSALPVEVKNALDLSDVNRASFSGSSVDPSVPVGSSAPMDWSASAPGSWAAWGAGIQGGDSWSIPEDNLRKSALNWKDYFLDREKEDALRTFSGKEIQKHNQWREHAMDGTLTKTARVFLWEVFSEDPPLWLRKLVVHTRTLEFSKHSSRQRLYCPIRNEWNLIKEMDIEPLPLPPPKRFILPIHEDKLMQKAISRRPSKLSQPNIDDRPVTPAPIEPTGPSPAKAMPTSDEDCPLGLGSTPIQRADTLPANRMQLDSQPNFDDRPVTPAPIEPTDPPPAKAMPITSDEDRPIGLGSTPIQRADTLPANRMQLDDDDVQTSADVMQLDRDDCHFDRTPADVMQLDHDDHPLAQTPAKLTPVTDKSESFLSAAEQPSMTAPPGAGPLFTPFLQMARFRFGFTYPPATGEYPDHASWKGSLTDKDFNILRNKFLDNESDLDDDNELRRHLHNFMSALVDGGSLPPPSVGPQPKPPSPLSKSRVVTSVITPDAAKSKRSGTLFLLEVGRQSEDWSLYVNDASVAVECLRRQFISTRDIAMLFLRRGTPFAVAFEVTDPGFIPLASHRAEIERRHSSYVPTSKSWLFGSARLGIS